MKRVTKTGAEQDVVSRYRRVHCYLGRPGVTAGIKRDMNRRDRREAKAAIRAARLDGAE